MESTEVIMVEEKSFGKRNLMVKEEDFQKHSHVLPV